MSDFNYNRGYDTTAYSGMETRVTSAVRNVYFYMCGALVITAVTAWGVATSPAILNLIFGNQLVFWGMLIAEIGLVVYLTAAIQRMSVATAHLMFALYSILNGATLSSIFLVYQLGSIGTTFMVCAGTFGAMALIGTVTRKDLTGIGHLCIMAVIGLVIAMLVNMFMHNSMLDLVISGIGVLVFTGLTAYDAQKIKYMVNSVEDEDMNQKVAVLGALSLYLDFVNLFLYLLRFFGKRK